MSPQKLFDYRLHGSVYLNHRSVVKAKFRQIAQFEGVERLDWRNFVHGAMEDIPFVIRQKMTLSPEGLF